MFSFALKKKMSICQIFEGGGKEVLFVATRSYDKIVIVR